MENILVIFLEIQKIKKTLEAAAKLMTTTTAVCIINIHVTPARATWKKKKNCKRKINQFTIYDKHINNDNHSSSLTRTAKTAQKDKQEQQQEENISLS